MKKTRNGRASTLLNTDKEGGRKVAAEEPKIAVERKKKAAYRAPIQLKNIRVCEIRVQKKSEKGQRFVFGIFQSFLQKRKRFFTEKKSFKEIEKLV